MRNLLTIGLVGLGLLFSLRSTQAQDSVLAELYGLGVHSYFSGQYAEAHEYLTTSIEQGSLDPRAYYFRGLSYTRLGRPVEAKMDFEKGAQLEISGADRIYPVSRSLQRVQGRTRLDIEKQRQMARLVALRQESKAKAARYEQLKNAEGEVLRDPNRPEPAKAVELVGPAPANASDPFAAGTAPAAPEVTAAPPAAEVDDAAGGADVFGAGNADPMPAASDDSDPFGAPAPAAGDANNDPFSDDPPAMDAADDPFGS